MPDTPARSYTAGFAGKRLARENGRAVPHRQRRRDSAGLRPWLNPNPIIDRRPDTLPRSQVLLGRLNRDMTEQKLDLIQLTARTPAQPSAGSSQVVRCKRRDTCAPGRRLHYVPYCLFADTVPEHSAHAADPAKDFPSINRSGAEPIDQLQIHPFGHRDSAYMTSLANEVHDGPMVLPLLQVFGSQIRGLVTSQSARH